MAGLQLFVELANGEQFSQSGVFADPVVFKYSKLSFENSGVFKFITGGRQAEFYIVETVNIITGTLGDDVAYSPDDLTKDSLFVYEYYMPNSGGAN